MTLFARPLNYHCRFWWTAPCVLVVVAAACFVGCEKADQPASDHTDVDAGGRAIANESPQSDGQQAATPTAKAPAPVQPPPTPLPVPNLDRFAEAVQRQITDARAKVKANPNDPEAVGRLAMLYQAYDLSEAAEMWYRLAIQLEPTRFRWHYLLAHVYSHQGDAEKAVEAFVRAILLQPQYVPAKITLANVLLNSGSFDQALRLVEDARQYDNESPIVGYTAGMIQMARENYAEAAVEFEQVLASHPQYGGVRAVLASAYRELGRTKDADRLLAERAVNKDIPRLSDPERAAAFRLATGYEAELLKGAAYMQRHKPAAALEHFEKAIAFEPSDAVARIRKSEAMVSLRRFAEAESLLSALVHEDNKNTDAQLRLADVLLMQNKAPQALPIIKDLERLGQDNLTLIGLKARYAMATGNFADAVTHYRILARANPENAHVLLELGNARLLNGEIDNAKRAFLKAMELLPQDPLVMNRMAMAYVEEGDFKTASSWFKRSIESDYATPDLFLDYARAAAVENQFDLTAQILREGRKRFPKSGDLALKQARLLAMCPDKSVRDGEAALKLAQQLHGQFGDGNPDVVDVLAVALAVTGNKVAAIGKLEGLLSSQRGLDESTAARLRGHLETIKRGQLPTEAP